MEIYRECMRNHAATLGTYAADGCCEYTPEETSSGGLHCAACGCHRNFHRKVVVGNVGTVDSTTQLAGYSPESAETRRRARTKFSAEQKARMAWFAEKIGWRLPRREADDDAEMARFCREIGVCRRVFKIWMHNHKNSSASSSTSNVSSAYAAVAVAAASMADSDEAKASPHEE